MSRLPCNSSPKLEALMDERDHLHVTISLEADKADADVEKLMAMSTRLAAVEIQIAAERRDLDGDR